MGKLKLGSLFCALFCAFAFLEAEQFRSFLDRGILSEEGVEIAVHNRILAKVNGKAITVMDVMKKMDMIFYREFSEYASSKMARYQFYVANWKHVLEDLVNKELILADAEEAKLVISNGEVRREMEQLFGPNIIANLDKIGMNLDEAWAIVKGDITLRRMMFYRVNSKAMRQVGPQEIRAAYEEYVKSHVQSDEWHYHVISIRDKDSTRGAHVASLADELIQENANASFEEIAVKIKALPTATSATKVAISEEFVHNDLQLSPTYREILSTLQPGAFTPPLSQVSRSDKTTIFRIFYLKSKVDRSTPSFSEVECELKDKLLEENIAKETELYLKKLRQHFAVGDDQVVPDDFQPFTKYMP